MANLDWSIPVAEYTSAHWEAVEQGERDKDERKSYQDLYPQEGWSSHYALT